MKNLMEDLNNIPYRLCTDCGKCTDYQADGKNYPKDIWAKLPLGCGYTGWVFQKIEEEKQKVRKLKEILLELNVQLKLASSADKQNFEQQIKDIKNKIEPYEKYGAKDW